jgi:serine protease Do
MDKGQKDLHSRARSPQGAKPGSSPAMAGQTLLAANVVLTLLLLFGLCEAKADIYQYKDPNGNWVITDVPPSDAKILQTIKDRTGRSASPSGLRDVEKELTQKYRPRGVAETASLSTVTLQSPMGVGSGFFINESGYILTNRHVLRGDENQLKETEKTILKMDEQIEADEEAIVHAEAQLKGVRSNLDDFKASIDRMTDPGARSSALQKYQSQAKQYDFYEAQLRKRKSDLVGRKSKYLQQKGDFARKTQTARDERVFGVVLKDGTELEATLVSVSSSQDLALLRIEGCKSPSLPPGAQDEIVQGMRVFAIGSPLGVGDSVSAGVVSGYDRDFIRTDAKIYPGNSGGPLITADGKVIGINSMKLITQKFEGIGYAIPIRRALEEFKRYLEPNR